MINLAALDRPPAGFAACPVCAYRDTGSAPICFTCASEHTEPPVDDRCMICERALDAHGRCGNPICNWPVDERFFNVVWAISMRTGQMREAISRYKYDGKRGWAAIFGRILVGFLNEYRDEFADYDLIIPSPTYVDRARGRTFDHIGDIMRAAAVEEPTRWPFALDVLEKTAPTERFAGKTWPQRREIAEGPLRDALDLPSPDVVRGCSVLVVDDVFTEGFTIREVARALTLAGAEEVSEIVLAREPWKG